LENILTTKDLVLIALFSALIVALGLFPPIPVVGIPAPITAQTLGVMLAGTILGAKRGVLSVVVVLVLVAVS
jgi:biotin transport system substrate-specific component